MDSSMIVLFYLKKLELVKKIKAFYLVGRNTSSMKFLAENIPFIQKFYCGACLRVDTS